MLFDFAVFLILVYFVSISTCANILAVVPCPSYSHQIGYTHLWKKLSLRGHKVTVITTDPLNDQNLVNLTEINVNFSYDTNSTLSKSAENDQVTMWTFHGRSLDVMRSASEAQLSHPSIQELIHNSSTVFDLVFVEFLTPEWLAFAEKHNASKILFASMEVTASFYHLTGNPAHPVLNPEFVSPFHGPLNFQERVISTVLAWYYKYLFAFKVFPERQKIMKNYFKTDSTMTELISDLDLMFLSISSLIQGPRALSPNIIPIAGYREDVSLESIPLLRVETQYVFALNMLIKLIGIVLYFVNFLEGANILAILPCPSYSHQIAYTHLWKRLSLRGHKVIVITTDPLNDPSLTNLTEIDVSFSYKFLTNISHAAEENAMNMWKFHAAVMEVMEFVSEGQLTHPQVQDLIKNPKSFDVVFVEFVAPEFLAFAEIYNCPKILFASMEITSSLYHIIGNPAHPILHPEFVSSFHGELSFQERLISTLLSWHYKCFFATKWFPAKQHIMDKYFNTTSTVTELLSDLDMMFLSVSPLIHGPRALGPNTISFGGYREDVTIQPLPSDIKKFLDDAKEGCVYVSLGSNVKSSQLSIGLQKILIDALSDLPYKVLWKYEDENYKMPKNIKTAKWLPQPKILTHPNVKVFLCQGGLQSTEESIYGEVPFVVIPFFSDQHQNARILENKGIAIVLDRKTFSKDDLKNAIIEVITNPKYLEGVKKLKELILDEPLVGVDKAVWWTEYVIRHKGAKHLRNPAADLPLYQYYLLDVIGFLLTSVILTVTILVLILKKLWRCIAAKYCNRKEKSQ